MANTLSDFVLNAGGSRVIKKILIANNGISAVKCIRSVRRWAYDTFGNEREIVFTVMATPEDLEANAEYIRMADEFVEVPGGSNNNNYANVRLIVELAERCGVDAVWAGWGHASENPLLPDTLAKTASNVVFIGPPGRPMQALGDKIGSTLIAQSAGVPIIPWNGQNLRVNYKEDGKLPDGIFEEANIKTVDEALAVCDQVGFPLMIKASEGGGGKGIRKAMKKADLAAAFRQVQGEIPGSPIFLMQLASDARHLEVQLLADQYGNAIALSGRDCSVQRRHQKIVEEGPPLAPPADVWLQMQRAAVALAKEVDYVNAGTVEYLYMSKTSTFAFLELNPRLQVEHPVTEMITGVNLPACQLQVAMGIPLHRIADVRRYFNRDPKGTESIDFDNTTPRTLDGHVIASRITAENPDSGFQPTSGSIRELNFRSTPDVWGYFSVDASGSVHEFADSQIGHLFGWGPTREAARKSMVLALKELSIRGDIRTTVEYLVQLLETDDFRSNLIDTAWLDKLIQNDSVRHKPDRMMVVAMGATVTAHELCVRKEQEYMSLLDRGQVPPADLLRVDHPVQLIYDGTKYCLQTQRSDKGIYTLRCNNSYAQAKIRQLSDGGYLVRLGSRSHVAYVTKEPTGLRLVVDGATCMFTEEYDPTQLRAAMNGKLVKYLTEDGARLEAGEAYAEVEVMKMYLPLLAMETGRVQHVKPEGSVLEPGEVVARMVLEDASKVRKADVFQGSLPDFDDRVNSPQPLGNTGTGRCLQISMTDPVVSSNQSLTAKVMQRLHPGSATEGVSTVSHIASHIRPHVRAAGAEGVLRAVLSGYHVPDDVIERAWRDHDVCYANPVLPLHELKDVLSTLSGRLPFRLADAIQHLVLKHEEAIARKSHVAWPQQRDAIARSGRCGSNPLLQPPMATDENTRQARERLEQYAFPIEEFEALLDAELTGLSDKDKAAMRTQLAPLYGVVERYRYGVEGAGRRSLWRLLLTYVDVESIFGGLVALTTADAEAGMASTSAADTTDALVGVEETPFQFGGERHSRSDSDGETPGTSGPDSDHDDTVTPSRGTSGGGQGSSADSHVGTSHIKEPLLEDVIMELRSLRAGEGVDGLRSVLDTARAHHMLKARNQLVLQLLVRVAEDLERAKRSSVGDCRTLSAAATAAAQAERSSPDSSPAFGGALTTQSDEAGDVASSVASVAGSEDQRLDGFGQDPSASPTAATDVFGIRSAAAFVPLLHRIAELRGVSYADVSLEARQTLIVQQEPSFAQRAADVEKLLLHTVSTPGTSSDDTLLHTDTAMTSGTTTVRDIRRLIDDELPLVEMMMMFFRHPVPHIRKMALSIYIERLHRAYELRDLSVQDAAEQQALLDKQRTGEDGEANDDDVIVGTGDAAASHMTAFWRFRPQLRTSLPSGLRPAESRDDLSSLSSTSPQRTLAQSRFGAPAANVQLGYQERPPGRCFQTAGMAVYADFSQVVAHFEGVLEAMAAQQAEHEAEHADGRSVCDLSEHPSVMHVVLLTHPSADRFFTEGRDSARTRAGSEGSSSHMGMSMGTMEPEESDKSTIELLQRWVMGQRQTLQQHGVRRLTFILPNPVSAAVATPLGDALCDVAVNVNLQEGLVNDAVSEVSIDVPQPQQKTETGEDSSTAASRSRRVSGAGMGLIHMSPVVRAADSSDSEASVPLQLTPGTVPSPALPKHGSTSPAVAFGVTSPPPPCVYTFRERLAWREDAIVRHIEPSAAVHLELKRLSNFHIFLKPTPNRAVHVYEAFGRRAEDKPMARGDSARRHRSNPAERKRFFVRGVVRRTEPIQYIGQAAEQFPGPEQAFKHALDALNIAMGDALRDTNLPVGNNQIFLNILPVMEMTCFKARDTIQLLARRYAARLRRLRVTNVEFRLCSRESPMDPIIPVRLIASNPTGYVLNIDMLMEVEATPGASPRALSSSSAKARRSHSHPAPAAHSDTIFMRVVEHEGGVQRAASESSGVHHGIPSDPAAPSRPGASHSPPLLLGRSPVSSSPTPACSVNEDDLHGKPVNVPYPVSTPFERRRAVAAARSETLFCYDFIDLFAHALKQDWRDKTQRFQNLPDPVKQRLMQQGKGRFLQKMPTEFMKVRELDVRKRTVAKAATDSSVPEPTDGGLPIVVDGKPVFTAASPSPAVTSGVVRGTAGLDVAAGTGPRGIMRSSGEMGSWYVGQGQSMAEAAEAAQARVGPKPQASQYPRATGLAGSDDSGEFDDYELVVVDRVPGRNLIGMVAWWITLYTPEYPQRPDGSGGREMVVIANDITKDVGTFGVAEDRLFYLASKYARTKQIPRIYLAANSGARIGLDSELKKKFHVAWQDPTDISRGFKYLYLTDEDYRAVTAVGGECPVLTETVTLADGTVHHKLTDIIGKDKDLGVENLKGSGAIAGETSRAYNEGFTLTYVTGRSVGIGAYLVRLGQRTIQKRDSAPIILTGFEALNKLIGSPVYTSNLQLGGPKVMFANGVSHVCVNDDLEGIRQVLKWLSFVPARCIPTPRLTIDAVSLYSDGVSRNIEFEPSDSPYDPRHMMAGHMVRQASGEAKWVSGFFDRGSWQESLAGWAKTVVVGRARLGGIPMGVIVTETRAVSAITPADPAALESTEVITQQAGQVWYPDSAFKTAQALRDFKGESLPVMIFANWRGFSGGQRDMFQEVLKFGADIVDALVDFQQPVFVYIPPYGELRGGAWVVVDPSINARCMEMYADMEGRGGVLEPSGAAAIKYRAKDLLATAHRLDSKLQALDAKLSEEGLAPERRTELRTQVGQREKDLMPIYLQVAHTFAGLHDTPGRMLAKRTIRKIVPWKRARFYFYKRLLRRLAEMALVQEVQDKLRGGTYEQAMALVHDWQQQDTDTATPVPPSLTTPGGNVTDKLVLEDQNVLDWLRTHHHAIKQRIAALGKEQIAARIRSLCDTDLMAVLQGAVSGLQQCGAGLTGSSEERAALLQQLEALKASLALA